MWWIRWRKAAWAWQKKGFKDKQESWISGFIHPKASFEIQTQISICKRPCRKYIENERCDQLAVGLQKAWNLPKWISDMKKSKKSSGRRLKSEV
jgi:hypothetical protein